MVRSLLLQRGSKTNVRHANSYSTSEISEEILGYLMENPEAQDTIEGILHWWILQQEIRRSASLIREALAVLVSKGLVLERQGIDMQTYYRINREKLHVVAAFLAEKQREAKG